MPRVNPANDLARRLAALVLPDAEGATVVLGELWADTPLILVHLRHFG